MPGSTTVSARSAANEAVERVASCMDQVESFLQEIFSLTDRVFDEPASTLYFRPDEPDAWNIAEHLEHISLVNHFLLLTIRKGCEKAGKRAKRQAPPLGESDLSRLFSIAVPGAFDWPPPPHMVPSGLLDPKEVRETLREQAVESRRLLSGMPDGEGKLCTIRMSVNDLGRLDMYQWLFFLAQHARYHLALIQKRLEEASKEAQGDGGKG